MCYVVISYEYVFRRKDKWYEVNKSHLIGYDFDDKMEIELIRDIKNKFIIVKLEKDR